MTSGKVLPSFPYKIRASNHVASKMFSTSKPDKRAPNNYLFQTKFLEKWLPFFSGLSRCPQPDLEGELGTLREWTSFLCFGFQSLITLVPSMKRDFKNSSKFRKTWRSVRVWIPMEALGRNELQRQHPFSIPLPHHSFPEPAGLYNFWETLLSFIPQAFLENS